MLLDEVRPLQHITHLDNLARIRRAGLCCHNTVSRFPVREVLADPDVMRRRERLVGSNGLRLKDYAALYLNAHNPMLAARQDVDGVVVLEADAAAVLALPGALLTDGNAAAVRTRVGEVKSMLPSLSAALVYRQRWKDDPAARVAVQCEALAEEFVPARLVTGARVPRTADAKAVQAVWPGLGVRVDPRFFFRAAHDS